MFLSSWWFLASGLVKRHWPRPWRLYSPCLLSQPIPCLSHPWSPPHVPVDDLELGLECCLSMLESRISPLDLDTWRTQCSVKVPTLPVPSQGPLLLLSDQARLDVACTRPSVSRLWGSELPIRVCERGKELILIPSHHPKLGLKLEAGASAYQEGPTF